MNFEPPYTERYVRWCERSEKLSNFSSYSIAFQPCGIPTLLKGDKQMLGRNDELINDKKLRCIELKGEGLWQEVQ